MKRLKLRNDVSENRNKSNIFQRKIFGRIIKVACWRLRSGVRVTRLSIKAYVPREDAKLHKQKGARIRTHICGFCFRKIEKIADNQATNPIAHVIYVPIFAAKRKSRVIIRFWFVSIARIRMRCVYWKWSLLNEIVLLSIILSTVISDTFSTFLQIYVKREFID